MPFSPVYFGDSSVNFLELQLFFFTFVIAGSKNSNLGARLRLEFFDCFGEYRAKGIFVLERRAYRKGYRCLLDVF